MSIDKEEFSYYYQPSRLAQVRNESNETFVLECRTAHSVFTNFHFRNVLLAELIISVLAITPNALVLSIIWRVKVFPSNLRLLLGNLSFVLLWFSLGAIAKLVYLLRSNPCTYSMNQVECRLFDLATTWLTLPSLYYSLFPLCVERLYATINYRINDIVESQKKPIMAMILIVCAWIAAALINGHTLPGLPTDRYVPICDMTFMPAPSKVTPTFCTYLLLQLLSGIATAFVFFYNRHVARSMAINRARYDLSARFQIDQNVQINAVIIPTMILHFFFHLPAFVIQIIQMQSMFDWSVETKAIGTRLTIVLRMVFALTHPLCALYFNTHLKVHLFKSRFGSILRQIGIGALNEEEKVRRTNARNRVGGAATAAHFDYLDQLWSKPMENHHHHHHQIINSNSYHQHQPQHNGLKSATRMAWENSGTGGGSYIDQSQQGIVKIM